jgi:hypothetical protein
MSCGIKSFLKKNSFSLDFLICVDVCPYPNKLSTTFDTLFHFFGPSDGFIVK